MADRTDGMPQRHEAPLTAAQLHNDMEKEQEAVVGSPAPVQSVLCISDDGICIGQSSDARARVTTPADRFCSVKRFLDFDRPPRIL